MEVIDWKNYRRVTGELTWRPALPSDQPAIDRLRRVTTRLLGREQRNPDLFRPPVLLALVAEDKRGKIVDLLYIEAQVELIKMGATGDALDEGTQLAEDLRAFLRARGFRKAIIVAASDLKDRMAARIKRAGFECVDGILSYWLRGF